VLERLDMGQKLAEAGHPDMSSAVRPMALAPDEKQVYFQVSFFHGFVEYDLVRDRVLRLAHLPISEEAAGKRREEYLLDSAHHGLAMNPQGTKLCVAGTMSDYAAIVRRVSFAHRIAAHGLKPYWSTNSGDGRYCFISFSGDDRVSVVSYATEREVASVRVGDHPQRMRMGTLAEGALGVPAGSAGPARPGGPRLKLRVSVRPRRVRAGRPVRLRVRVTVKRGGRRGRAVLRKRRGFERVRRYRVRASRKGYRTGYARIRATRG
jgi:hypothetical protein